MAVRIATGNELKKVRRFINSDGTITKKNNFSKINPLKNRNNPRNRQKEEEKGEREAAE